MNFSVSAHHAHPGSIKVPEVRLTGANSIKVGGQEIAVNPQSRQARVLEYFFGSPKGLLRRQELLTLLYEEELSSSLNTIRYEDSLWSSGHKIMSRLRKTLATKFAGRVPDGTEWLPFSNVLDGWILFKLPGYGSDGGWHP